MKYFQFLTNADNNWNAICLRFFFFANVILSSSNFPLNARPREIQILNIILLIPSYRARFICTLIISFAKYCSLSTIHSGVSVYLHSDSLWVRLKFTLQSFALSKHFVTGQNQTTDNCIGNQVEIVEIVAILNKLHLLSPILQWNWKMCLFSLTKLHHHDPFEYRNEAKV